MDLFHARLFDLRLIQPTGMLGGVVDGKATPPAGPSRSPKCREREPAECVEIIQHKMMVRAREPLQGFGELGAGAVGRGPGEVAAR